MSDQFHIHWYPGHMARAKRELTEAVRGTDFIIEVVDARAPRASRNPDIDTFVQHRPRLIVLAKSDLAPSDRCSRWIDVLKRDGAEVIAACLLDEQARRDVKRKVERWSESFGSTSGRTMAPRLPGVRLPRSSGPRRRGVVVGMPNTGKSTLIRSLGGRGVNVGAKPGVTRRVSLVTIGKNAEVFDTPGLMWPRSEHGLYALKLAWIGAVSDDVFDMEAAALHFIDWAKHNELTGFFKRFDCSWNSGQTARELLTYIAVHRGYVRSSREPDLARTAQMIIHEFRNGRFGPVCLDDVDE